MIRACGGVIAAALLLSIVALGAVPSGAADARASLQELIDAAEPGSVLHLEPGVYEGGVEIDKPLTLDGGGAAVIDGGGEGTVLVVSAPDVTLTGLTVRGSGGTLDKSHAGLHVAAPRVTVRDNRFEDVLFGITTHHAADTTIVDNVIVSKDLPRPRRGDGVHLYESPRSLVAGNEILDGRDVIAFFSDEAVVRDNVIRDGRYGLHLMYSDGVLVEGNRFLDGSVGTYVMYSGDVVLRDNVFAGARGPSGYGLAMKESDLPMIEGNRFVDNRTGAFFDGTPFTAGLEPQFRNNVVAYNDVGLVMQSATKGQIFTENAFIDNRAQVSTTSASGRIEGNSWSLDGIGNLWSDYAGYDADGDGVGDLPYKSRDLFDDITDDHPELTFFADTPASRAIDMAARAFPTLRPDPKVVDDAPLVEAPEFPPLADAPVDTSRLGLMLISAGMVGVAGLLVGAARRRPRVGLVAA